jgi:hypothetical protein
MNTYIVDSYVYANSSKNLNVLLRLGANNCYANASQYNVRTLCNRDGVRLLRGTNRAFK